MGDERESASLLSTVLLVADDVDSLPPSREPLEALGELLNIEIAIPLNC